MCNQASSMGVILPIIYKLWPHPSFSTSSNVLLNNHIPLGNSKNELCNCPVDESVTVINGESE